MYNLLCILIIVIGILYTGSRSKHRLTTLLVILLAVLIICYVRYKLDGGDTFTGGIPPLANMAALNYTMQNPLNPTPAMFPPKPPAEWDGLKLKAPAGDVPELISNVTIFSPVGDGILLTENNTANPVDGKEGSPRSLFMFANNQSHLSCCPGTYSDSRGCVCITPAQKEMLSTRYGNNTHPTF